MSLYEAEDNKYQSISCLGQCCNGIAMVHLARHISTNTLVAVKKFNIDKAKDDICLIEHEIILTRQLQHPNILPYLNSFVNGPEVCVVTPLMAFGSCKDLMVNHFTQGLPELAIANILRDVLQGIDYIHKKGLIHRAIRGSHILISSSGKACLTGLRYACLIVENGKWQKQIHSFPLSTAKNLNWLSPELLEQNLQGYNEKSDIYSIGMTSCELANGIVPFAAMPTTMMLIEKVRGSAPQLLDCTTLPAEPYENDDFEINYQNDDAYSDRKQSTSAPKTQIYSSRRFTDAFHGFAEVCLRRKPHERPSASGLLGHPFFKLCKRGELLPDLLHPVMPINDQIGDNADDWEAILAAEKLKDLEISTCEWDF